MSSTVSSCEAAWSRHCWQVRDGCKIAAYALCFSYITGWVWTLYGSSKM